MSASTELNGQVALVTGASSGLGTHFATILHSSGAMVVATGRRGDRLNDLRATLDDNIHPIVSDIAVAGERELLVQEVLDTYGRIDILVNNAGIVNLCPAEDEPLESFERVLNINLIAVFHMCQLAGRSMLAQGRGAIVNIASVMGLVASAPMNEASYCASKGGVIHLTRELAAQWARRGVRVNALAPGWFPTEMNEGMWEDDRSVRYVTRNTPMGRTGRLDELDDALRFLVSDDNSFYTGQVLTVDGGWTIR